MKYNIKRYDITIFFKLFTVYLFSKKYLKL